jgi:hypothetical protein
MIVRKREKFPWATFAAMAAAILRFRVLPSRRNDERRLAAGRSAVRSLCGRMVAMRLYRRRREAGLVAANKRHV